MSSVHVIRMRQAPAGAPPSAIAPAALCLASAASALGLGYAAGLAWRDLLVAPVSLVLLGLLLAGRRALERRRRTARADGWIRHAHGGHAGPYGWRVAELTAPRERRLLARSVRGVVSDLSPNRLPGAVPLNRVALRPHAPLLCALAARLDALEHPVRAAGVLAVHGLLTDPASPLYARPAFDDAEEAPDAARAIRAVLDRLEVR
jgi:hypothetical protein